MKPLVSMMGVVTLAVVMGVSSASAQEPVGLPQQLAAMRQQLAEIQSSLGALPDHKTALEDIQDTLDSVTDTLTAIQQSLANVDPTVARSVTLATSHAYGAAGTSIGCTVQNVGTTPLTVTVTQLDIAGAVHLQTDVQLDPGNGNGLSLNGPGGAGGAAHRWCKFEYQGAPNAIRAHMSVADFATGIERAVHAAQ
jgi:hypothetical protein